MRTCRGWDHTIGFALLFDGAEDGHLGSRLSLTLGFVFCEENRRHRVGCILDRCVVRSGVYRCTLIRRGFGGGRRLLRLDMRRAARTTKRTSETPMMRK